MDDMTRPIVGIENRTAQEVFDMMCDRFRRASPSQVAPQPQAGEPALHDPYMRIVTMFDRDETAASFLNEDGDGGFAGGVYRMAREIDRLRALTSRLRAGVQDRDGLSEWAGWDKSRDPWSETKHKDAVLEALFRGPWSVEDAAALIGFIDRTWTKRPASPSVSEGGSRG